MQRTKSRSRHNNHDLYGDLAKIKGALFDAVHHAKGRAGNTLSQYWDDTKEGSANLHEKVSNFTAEKPLKTIGITLVTGVLIGYFLRK